MCELRGSTETKEQGGEAHHFEEQTLAPEEILAVPMYLKGELPRIQSLGPKAVRKPHCASATNTFPHTSYFNDPVKAFSP